MPKQKRAVISQLKSEKGTGAGKRLTDQDEVDLQNDDNEVNVFGDGNADELLGEQPENV